MIVLRNQEGVGVAKEHSVLLCWGLAFQGSQQVPYWCWVLLFTNCCCWIFPACGMQVTCVCTFIPFKNTAPHMDLHVSLPHRAPSPPPPGVIPPYFRPLPRGHTPGPPLFDWRWAVGATPFGPYSNFHGASEIMQNVARRNLLLAHISSALRAAQHGLDDLDEFVGAHFGGPWVGAGMGADPVEGRKHFLDTVVR